MKNWFIPAFCITGLFALAGCSNDHLIHTTDGQSIEASDKPELDEDTGMLEYEDHSGRENQIQQEEVREINER